MKVTIHKKVSRDKLVRVLPESLALGVPKSLAEPVTAVVFRDEVVTGRVARQALERIGLDFGALLLFAAGDFTREASEAALAADVLLISSAASGGCFWSDESLFEIHVSMTKNNKRPRPRPSPKNAPEEPIGNG